MRCGLPHRALGWTDGSQEPVVMEEEEDPRTLVLGCAWEISVEVVGLGWVRLG